MQFCLSDRYCQGLNRVAAVALLYLSEEEAFWCLVAIVECIMPENYYSLTLTASQVRSFSETHFNTHSVNSKCRSTSDLRKVGYQLVRP